MARGKWRDKYVAEGKQFMLLASVDDCNFQICVALKYRRDLVFFEKRLPRMVGQVGFVQ